ncbi:MAG: tetratricopeptide repeat protein [Desulfomonile sp.]
MKNTRWFISWPVIFGLGFLAGVVFSAWKLDNRTGQVPVQQPETREHNKQVDIQSRIAGIERMLEVNPGNVEALVQLGNDYFDTGNYEKAVASYQKALSIDPRNPDVITDMAVGYRRLGKPQDAVSAFRRALEIDPDHSIALFNMGLVLRDEVKDYAGAVDAWEKFLQKAGDSPHAVMVRPWIKKLREKATPDKGSTDPSPSQDK